ncbi:HRDC domain-containing protein [Methylocucumis oryzae]|uniref:HRDC domain-containing protein n=1 Tax=Methylocucumis oryzae TaxID=1632867 RepID=UPI000B2B92A1
MIRDELLFDLAKLQPESLTELMAVRGMSERTVARYGKELCRLIIDAKNRGPKPLYEKGRPAKKTQQQEAILDMLTALVRIRAEQNALNPSILASRKDLEMLLLGEEEDCPLLHGWRYTMAGQELVGLIQGQLLFGIDDGRLTVIEKQTSFQP